MDEFDGVANIGRRVVDLNQFEFALDAELTRVLCEHAAGGVHLGNFGLDAVHGRDEVAAPLEQEVEEWHLMATGPRPVGLLLVGLDDLRQVTQIDRASFIPAYDHIHHRFGRFKPTRGADADIRFALDQFAGGEVFVSVVDGGLELRPGDAALG